MHPKPATRVEVTKDGPYRLHGAVPIAEQAIVTNAAGESIEWREGKRFEHADPCALCRCGGTATPPFCNGTHERNGFDGTETASREPFAKQMRPFPGPTVTVEDAQALCAYARFCDPFGQVWNLVRRSDQLATRALVEHEAGHCPSGRLVAVDRASGRAVEPKHAPSVGVVEDTAEEVRGPLWIRGGIPVFGADGHAYEVRNRVTLCRCGRSGNKPFCDGAHAAK